MSGGIGKFLFLPHFPFSPIRLPVIRSRDTCRRVLPSFPRSGGSGEGGVGYGGLYQYAAGFVDEINRFL